ncbi:hypothetical protein Tco_0692025 [Tanacetum coccineum]
MISTPMGDEEIEYDVDLVLLGAKQDRVVIGSQALSVALDICRGRMEKMERNLVERLPFLKDVFVSLDHHLSVEALIEPLVEVPATNVLSTVIIIPHSGPSVSVEDYKNPDLVDVVPKNVLGSSLPSRSFNLYDPFPSASVTSYGPSHLGLNFPVSSTWLASLLWYTKFPGLKLAFLTLVL